MNLRRRRPELSVFGLSALDLFASGMGAFVLLAVLLFPHFRKIEPVLSETRQMVRDARDAVAAAAVAEAQARQAGQRAGAAARQAAQAASETADLDAETARLEAKEARTTQVLARCQATVAKLDIRSMDLVLAFDSTGSMADAMADMRRSLAGVVRVLHQMVPDLRIGLVTFRDDASFVTRSMPLTPMDDSGIAQALSWLKAQGADGGTGPRAVEKGLAAVAALSWRDVRRVVVLIGDDPDDDSAPHAAEAVARSLSRVSSISVKGQGGPFFEAVAKAGGGGYYVDPGGRMMESLLLAALED
ncbi:vWA domain-containing protein [Magnetospirillum sp. SS-4]|uniref:vWA domain-containing protein n=1 Tax=Magnetospirillum sp. SS-4 TaxID=2681465 RepID=UPI00137D7823|nr:vWA domain-containing protein [Magnetospirillum sp. SS-4]CAA7617165.1 exported hypothetical protein [Magnetospirillum sp. SS-4]